MKGQSHLMEYVLLMFFVVMIMVVLMFFLTGWQVTSSTSQQYEAMSHKAAFLLRAFANSPYLNKKTYPEGSMFEDSKLTAITCEDLRKLYGSGWYAELKDISMEGECNEETYPNCGEWTFCKKKEKSMVFDIPVNIYRKTTGEIHIGILKVGLYV
ncbi:MAG: hypothetical protein J7K72_02680 [Candidatus Aenigmarchaeota archaeon]|nr:hypothetical protein [Candidatus Aenigmarchaeota archaeon]